MKKPKVHFWTSYVALFYTWRLCMFLSLFVGHNDRCLDAAVVAVRSHLSASISTESPYGPKS